MVSEVREPETFLTSFLCQGNSLYGSGVMKTPFRVDIMLTGCGGCVQLDGRQLPNSFPIQYSIAYEIISSLKDDIIDGMLQCSAMILEVEVSNLSRRNAIEFGWILDESCLAPPKPNSWGH